MTGSALLTTPNQTFQRGFGVYQIIPNSIFLNTAWNKPSISPQQLAEDQAGPPWLELLWKQMRVRISEPLSSFRRSLIPTLFSLTSQAAQAAQPSRLVPAGTDPRAAVFPETIGPSDQGTATSVPSSPPFWHRLQVFHYDLSSVNLSKGLFFFFL